MQKIAQFFRLIRLTHWQKNGFVLLGFLALGEYRNFALLAKSIANTFAFCLASSAVYILNDYRDLEADRLHPIKKNRPLAAGTIGVPFALTGAIFFTAASLVFAGQSGLLSMAILAVYLLNNVLYSFGLKGYPIIDVFLIAFGFMLRIFAGTLGIGIEISEWLVLTGFSVSLLIGFAKRYAEISNYDDPSSQRHVLEYYSAETLKAFLVIMAAACIITYALYTVSPRSLRLHGSTRLIYTTPIVMFGIFRFLHLVLVKQGGEDPVNLFAQDRVLIGTVILWAITYGLIIS